MGIVKKFPIKASRQSIEIDKVPGTDKSKKFYWRHPWKTFLAIIICSNILFFAIGQQAQLQSLYADKAILEDYKQTLLEEQLRLEEKIYLLEQDETIEKIARERLGLIKPGERLLIIR